MISIKHIVVLSVLAIFTFSLVSWVSYSFWDQRDYIHRIDDAQVLTHQVKRGGILRLHYHVSRTRYCVSLAHRFIYSKEDGALVFSDVFPGGGAGLGEKRPFTLSQKLPDHLGPGKYVWKSYSTNDCDGRMKIVPSPDLEFEIIE